MPFLASITEYTLFCLCRYLVDSHWFKQWKKYVGFDSWDKYQMGEQNVYPGPVDNSGLLKGKKDKAQKIKTFLLPSFTFKTKLYICPFAQSKREQKHCFLVPKSSLFGSFAEPSSIPLFFCPLRDKCHTRVFQILLSACLFATLFWLLDGDVLAIKEHLIDELDYILVPTEGWVKLVSWYGLTESQEPIARKVILNTTCLSVINVITPINVNSCCW